MISAELATCRVPVDHASPASVGGTSWHARCFTNQDLVPPASLPLLTAIVLWLGAASFDSFRDPTYCGLRYLVRGLNGD
jgi:hypothetical protein